MSGYSGTPLVKKLGIKAEMSILVKNSPMEYSYLVPDLPVNLSFYTKWKKGLNFIHLFSNKKSELFNLISLAKKNIKPDGVIWSSWPKKSSKVPTDITEDIIRQYALKIDLVDIKVCAIDDVWSGLKLVIRKEKRYSMDL